MKIFIGAEVHATVIKKVSPILNVLEKKIKILLKINNYGPGITYWGHICIVNPKEFYEGGFLGEIKKYTRKNAEVELRLRISYDSVLNASEKELFKIICISILKGIDIVQKELSVDNFDFEAFRNDLVSLFKKEGWV